MSEYSSKRPGGVNAIINDERYRSVFYQVVVFGLFIWAVFSLIENTQINMATRKMAVGFDFLKNSAGLFFFLDGRAGEEGLPCPFHLLGFQTI